MENHPRYITNAPIGEDQFKGQSHKRISRAIAEEIRNGVSHMIGIEGGWGSGKSNLIRLVDKELNSSGTLEESPYPVIIYDAWGHISDLQRRSILEEVTNSLINEHKVLRGHWQNKLEDLLARKKATRTKKMPALSTPLITLLMSVLFVPLLNYFIRLTPVYSFWRWFLPSIYVLMVLGTMIAERVWSMRKYGQKINLSSIFGEMFMLYQGKISEDTTYEVVAEKEPSSRQFKDWMHSLDESLPDKTKRVVLVFDNLDRLPSNKVQEFWAAIHSFFAEEKFKKITLIVPFDRSHVINAFKAENNANNADGHNCYGNDFINKTFDTVYRVSPLILSDWKNYFTIKWKEAFGIDAELPNAITQIYDALATSTTPRDIISFINEYVSIAQTAIDQIPGQYISLFIFGKRTIERDPYKELLTPSFLKGLEFLYKNDPNLPKYLSALYFQLSVEEAMDIVFTRQCQQALDNNEPKHLLSLLEHPAVFESIFENAILAVSNMENVVLCLNELDLSNLSETYIDRLWECVFNKLNFSEIEKEEVKDYHMLLIKHLPARFKERLAYSIIKGYRYSEENNSETDNYIRGVRLLREYDEVLAENAISQPWEIEAELFVRLVERAEEDWNTMALDIEDEKLDSYLATLELEQLTKLKVVKLLHENAEEKYVDFTQYKKSLREKIKGNSTDLQKLCIILSRLKEIERPINDLRDIFTDSDLYQLSESSNVNEEDFYELVAIALARGTSYNQHSRGKIHSSFISTEDRFVDAVAKRIEAYIDYGDLLLNKNNFSQYHLGKSIVNQITRKSYGVSRCYLKDCLMDFDNIIQSYELDPKILFKRLSNWKNGDLTFSHDDIEKISLELVKQSLDASSSLAAKISELIERNLDNINQEEWKTILKNDSHILKLYLSYKPTKNRALTDAVFAIIKDTLTESKSSIPIPSLNEVLDKMIKSGEILENDFTSVVDLISTGYRITASIFCSIAPWIFKIAPNSINDVMKFERLIPSEILDNNEVIEVLENYQSYLLRYKKPDSFKSKLKQMASTSHASDQKFTNMVKSLGLIKVKEKKN